MQTETFSEDLLILWVWLIPNPIHESMSRRRLAVSQHLWKLESPSLSLMSAIDLKRKKPNSLGVSHLVQLTESNRDSG